MPHDTPQARQTDQRATWPYGADRPCWSHWFDGFSGIRRADWSTRASGTSRFNRAAGRTGCPGTAWISRDTWSSRTFGLYRSNWGRRSDGPYGLDIEFNDQQNRDDRCDHPSCSGHHHRPGTVLRSRSGGHIWGCVEYYNRPDGRHEGSYARLRPGRRIGLAHAFHGNPEVLG
jgi:hypothetical protein